MGIFGDFDGAQWCWKSRSFHVQLLKLKIDTQNSHLGGGFKHFYFHPYLERWSNLTNIFQVGWNHQLEIHVPRPISFWYPFIKFLGCTILGFYSFFAGDFWSGDSTMGWIYRTWKVDHFLLVQMLFSCVFSNHPAISGGCIKNPQQRSHWLSEIMTTWVLWNVQPPKRWGKMRNLHLGELTWHAGKSAFQ